MKVIILAAGMGTRLRPYTQTKPKALVEVFGQSIMQHQLDHFATEGIRRIAVVTGYQASEFHFPDLNYYHNDEFDQSNMVHSLMKASAEFDGTEDLIISYGDIIYRREILQKLMQTEGDVVVAADTEWLKLWSLRMEDPLADAESFQYKVRDNGQGLGLVEVGKPLTDLSQAQAQYMGLIKVSKSFQREWLACYQGQQEKAQNMYMTDFIQAIVNQYDNVEVSLSAGGWLEVDSVEDKLCYEQIGKVELLGKE